MPYSVQFVRIAVVIEVDGKEDKRYFQQHVLYGTSIGTFRRDHDAMIKQHIAEMILEDVELDDEEYDRRLEEYEVHDDMIGFHNGHDTLLDSYMILKEQKIEIIYEGEEFADMGEVESEISSEPPPKKGKQKPKDLKVGAGSGTRKQTGTAKAEHKSSTDSSLTAEKLASIGTLSKSKPSIGDLASQLGKTGI